MHVRPLGGAVEPTDGCPMRRSAGALEPGAESDGNTRVVSSLGAMVLQSLLQTVAVVSVIFSRVRLSVLTTSHAGDTLANLAGIIGPGRLSNGAPEPVAECLRSLHNLLLCPPVRADHRAC